MPVRRTTSTRRVLEALLRDPAREWYGLELMALASLASGTLYPILHRLEADGWLRSWPEDIDPSSEGRPRRRLYALTGHGVPAAHEFLSPSGAQTRRAPAQGAIRTTPGGQPA